MYPTARNRGFEYETNSLAWGNCRKECVPTCAHDFFQMTNTVFPYRVRISYCAEARRISCAHARLCNGRTIFLAVCVHDFWGSLPLWQREIVVARRSRTEYFHTRHAKNESVCSLDLCPLATPTDSVFWIYKNNDHCAPLIMLNLRWR